MAEKVDSLPELMVDARLVADYAVRSGRLPDRRLLDAITAAERALAAGQIPDRDALCEALNEAVGAIAPMTLLDLHAGRSPYGESRKKANRRLETFLSILTLSLIFLVGYYSQKLQQQDTALRALQDIRSAQALMKLTAVRKMAQSGEVFEKKFSHNDQYHQAVGELRQLADRINNATSLFNLATESSPWPLVDELRFLRRAPPREPPSFQPSFDPCAGGGWAPKEIGSLRWVEPVVADLVDDACFAARLNLTFHPYNVPGAVPVVLYLIQDRITLMKAWILPFLYGLLGSCVFLMRALVLRTPRPTGIELMPALLRIALGGVAGIVIGWFWFPAGGNGAEAAVTSIPFGLAFLAGFSIDLLFSLLDRLNKAISDSETTPARQAH